MKYSHIRYNYPRKHTRPIPRPAWHGRIYFPPGFLRMAGVEIFLAVLILIATRILGLWEALALAVNRVLGL